MGTGLDLAAAHGFACRIHIAAAVADHPSSPTGIHEEPCTCEAISTLPCARCYTTTDHDLTEVS